MSPSWAADWSARAWRLRCAARGLQRCVIEAHAPDSSAQPSFDERTTALGNASRRIFEALGIWQQLAAGRGADHRASMSRTPGVSDSRGSTPRELGQEALGYVVPNRVIGRALWAALQSDPAHQRLHARAPAVAGRVAADEVRRWH